MGLLKKKTREDIIIDHWESKRKEYERDNRNKGKLVDIFALVKQFAMLTYIMLIGTRDNGKTFAALSLALYRSIYLHMGMIAYVRRWDDEFKPALRATLFAPIVATGFITVLTEGEWSDVYYKAGQWYLSRVEEDGKLVIADSPFMTIFALNTSYKAKSMARGVYKTVVFEEFVAASAGSYCAPGEEECVNYWANLLSSIIGSAGDVLVIMAGNTLDPYCPYFSYMGLTHLDEMRDGDTQLYEYAGNADLRVLVNMSAKGGASKPSDKYFAFDSPELKAITGDALWTLKIYPHIDGDCPENRKKFKFHILEKGKRLTVYVMGINGNYFLRVKEPEEGWDDMDESHDLIYCRDPDPRKNWRTSFDEAMSPGEVKIRELVRRQKVFFDKNELGVLWDSFMAA